MEEIVMKQFMDENFLLSTETAQKLYHEYDLYKLKQFNPTTDWSWALQ